MLPAASEGLLDAYVSELVRWNSTIRLIGPKDEAGAAVQVVDSLLPYRETRLEFPLLDIGSGAGLPAVPLALLHPGERIVCLEPASKKASFIRHAARALRLEDFEVHSRKAEEAVTADPSLSGIFMTVTARAVAAVPVLLAWAEPYLAERGKVVLGRGDEVIPKVEGWVLEAHSEYPGHELAGKRTVAVFSRSNR